MKIEFSILSILSMAICLFMCLHGGVPSIDSISVDASLSSDSIRISAHPIIRIDADIDGILDTKGVHRCGFSFGNMIAIDSNITNTYKRNLVIEHELNHSEQWRGIGIVKPLVNGFFNMEGQDGNVETGWFASTIYRNRTMWEPPSWWPYKWSFVTISLNMGD